MSPRWWDAGRSRYAPRNPFVNMNMIWIAGFSPFVVVPAVILLFDWLMSR